MTPSQFQSIRKYLPNKNRLTGEPGWYVQLAEKFDRSLIWVQKAAKNQDGLNSPELDEAIMQMVAEEKMRIRHHRKKVRKFVKAA